MTCPRSLGKSEEELTLDIGTIRMGSLGVGTRGYWGGDVRTAAGQNR